MKAVILILLMTIVAAGQHRNTTAYAPLPAPGGPGTVTLSLSEYNRLVELASRKAIHPMRCLFLLCCRELFSSFGLKNKRS